MSERNTSPDSPATRRDFLKASAVAAGTALSASLVANVHAAGTDEIRVGLIGCGGRGSGAADNVMNAERGVKIVALADVFRGQAEGCRRRLEDLAKEDRVRQLGNSIDLPDSRIFDGLDAYEKLLATDVNYVMLATPPGFRPIHLAAAVAAGKTIFTEKPVGVDGPGIRKVLQAYEDAKSKGLAIAAGTQRRHQAGYIDTINRIHDGAIGEVLTARCYWDQGNIWFRPRREGQSDIEYQLHNWYHFVWLCGDHICEQHVHNLDVVNWVLRAHPIKAHGRGGRAARQSGDPNQVGQIFDHFAVEYEYPNGVRSYSYCRQIDGCENNVSEAVVGTHGHSQVNAYQIFSKLNTNSKQERPRRRGETDPYVQEHTDLIQSVRSGKPINELKNVAESTLTAILGRMASYTGKAVTWEQALHSREDTMPEKLSLKMDHQVGPIPVMGRTALV
jgi:predicted dehydrogenase